MYNDKFGIVCLSFILNIQINKESYYRASFLILVMRTC
jgi:hypothetical protein